MSDAPRNPFTVQCGECQHVWAAAWLPMEAGLFGKVTSNLHCPSCGNGPKGIFCTPGKLTSPGEKTS